VIVKIILSLLMFSAQPQASKDAFDLKELYRLEQVWNDAHQKGDADALDKLWAPDIEITVASMRQMTRTEALDMVRSNRMPFMKYETSDVKVRRFRDSALVTGRLHRERLMAGKPITDNWRFTKMYVVNGGRWQVIAWHASPAPQ
jgi:hypothetical protein